MNRMVDSPWFLRITALLLTVLLFIYVHGTQGARGNLAYDTATDLIEDVPVEATYDKDNTVVTGVPETVNVRITGPAQIVQSVKIKRDFKLFVDLRKQPIGENRTVKIQHENLSDKLHVQIDPPSVSVRIEEKVSQEFKVDYEFNEKLLADHYAVTDIDIVPKTVRITGAKSEVGEIAFVKAMIMGNKNIKGSFERWSDVRVLDKELNKMDVQVTPDNVLAKVSVAEMSKEVPILVKETGKLPAGLTLDSLSVDPGMIKLYGAKAALARYDSYEVAIDVSDIRHSGTFPVRLVPPKGIDKLSLGELTVHCQVTADPNAPPEEGTAPAGEGEAGGEAEPAEDPAKPSGEAPPEAAKPPAVKPPPALPKPPPAKPAPAPEPPKGNKPGSALAHRTFDGLSVQVDGLGSGLSGSITSPPGGKVRLIASGPPGLLKAIHTIDFRLSVDASGKEEGAHPAKLEVDGPSGIDWRVEPATVTLSLRKS